MGRLIDSDVAIEYLGKELHGDAYATAYTAIDKTPTAQQWIPCKVRRPEESGTYIVTAYDGVNNKRVSFVKYQKTLKRWDLTGARAYWSILAYKPLPEPWKEEDVVLKEIGRWIGYLDEDMIERIKIGIKKLPEAQQWIPCSERLPEDKRQVLVYAMNVHFALAKYDEMREADGTYKKQWVTFDAWKPYYTIKDVIAWMPLPDPYTPQEGKQPC